MPSERQVKPVFYERPVLHSIWTRNQRRLVFAALLSLLSGFAIFGVNEMAIVVMLGAVGASLLLVTLTPHLRTMCECSALGLCLASALPFPVHSLPAAVIGLSFASGYLIYGRWGERLGVSLSLVIDRRGILNGDPRDLWSHLVPTEAHPDDYWCERLVDFKRDPDDPDTVYARFRTENELFEEMTITFLERTQGQSCKYHIEREEPQGRDDLTMSLTIVDLADGTCHLHSKLEQHDLPARIAMARWFDNKIGPEFDGLANTLKGARRLRLNRIEGGWPSLALAQAVRP